VHGSNDGIVQIVKCTGAYNVTYECLIINVKVTARVSSYIAVQATCVRYRISCIANCS